jgi:predicted ribosome quality control (RQC) complex YloA/Tae2 family protein
MIDIAEETVTFSRETWEKLKADDYYKEVIQAIEDREDLLKAIEETEQILDFKEYDKNRRAKMNV